MPTIGTKPKIPLVNLQHLVDRVPGIVSVYNVHSGRYAFMNKSVKKVLGYDPAEFLQGGMELTASLIHPDDKALIDLKTRQSLEAANKTRPDTDGQAPIMSYEYRIRHAEGRWVWLHTEGSVYDRAADGTVDHVLNVCVEITKRKEAEEKLRALSTELEAGIKQHAERLHLALEASKMGTWEWNIETGELIWSPEMMVLYGLDPATDIISYEMFIGALHPSDRQKKQDILTDAVKTGEPYQVEHRCVWPDGSMHWILGQGQAYMKDGKPYRMVGTAMNIDERKATEAALQASQIAYETLYDSNVIGIFTRDKKGKIIAANDTFLNLIGYTKQDLQQGKIEQGTITPPEYDELDARKAREIIRKGEATPWEKEYLHKNGTRIPVLLGSVAIPNTDGLCITIVTDVTEREQLAALNKAKDEFISLASHQLRTPATAVKQYIGILTEQYFGDLNEQQLMTLKSAYESNERQLTIIDDLLKVARLDAGRLHLSCRRTDMKALLNNIIREQHMRFKARRQSIAMNTDAPKVFANIDRDRMYMVLGNIIDNAGKYTRPGKKIEVRLSKKRGLVQIEVEDQGVGIDKKDFGKLFQKFSRIDNPLSTAVGGTGLGLYWSKRVIDLHGGSIEVRSKVNAGTTFIIKIPATKNKARDMRSAITLK
jgi:PAS domain S-box-containing protein